MSRSDKQKLAAWKELINSTGNVVASAQCNTSLATALGATRENVDLAITRPSVDDMLTRRISDSMDGAGL